MDMGALLPMAAAFRRLLVLKGDRYAWRVNPKDVFNRCADKLYNAQLAQRQNPQRLATWF
ncbi:MAG: hypothetical protein HYX68_26050 [Planctomycetes bacterium]|nr:hypothetical protein [Planctomycetota bacterium]